MFRRSAWEPRWKYQAGRQHLCMNAAAEAALEGEWFDEKQPEPPPEPPPERVKRKYVKRARPFALREADMRLKKTWELADLTRAGNVL